MVCVHKGVHKVPVRPCGNAGDVTTSGERPAQQTVVFVGLSSALGKGSIGGCEVSDICRRAEVRVCAAVKAVTCFKRSGRLVHLVHLYPGSCPRAFALDSPSRRGAIFEY